MNHRDYPDIALGNETGIGKKRRIGMKWILTFTVTCLALVNQALAQTDDMVIKFADTNPRVWADSSNQNQMTARLLSRNT